MTTAPLTRATEATSEAQDRARTYLTACGRLTTDPEVDLVVAMLLEFYHRGGRDACMELGDRLKGARTYGD